MRIKAVVILLIIVFSLLPFYGLYQYLLKHMQPRESMGRFFAWLLVNLILVFVYTFLVVLVIRLLFPGA